MREQTRHTMKLDCCWKWLNYTYNFLIRACLLPDLYCDWIVCCNIEQPNTSLSSSYIMHLLLQRHGFFCFICGNQQGGILLQYSLDNSCTKLIQITIIKARSRGRNFQMESNFNSLCHHCVKCYQMLTMSKITFTSSDLGLKNQFQRRATIKAPTHSHFTVPPSVPQLSLSHFSLETTWMQLSQQQMEDTKSGHVWAEESWKQTKHLVCASLLFAIHRPYLGNMPRRIFSYSSKSYHM